MTGKEMKEYHPLEARILADELLSEAEGDRFDELCRKVKVMKEFKVRDHVAVRSRLRRASRPMVQWRHDFRG